MIGLNIEVNKENICRKCAPLHNIDYYLNHNALPVWCQDGIAMFTVPSELQDLTHAEKLLIQRVSPVVPLHHIKNGTMGLSGHVCAFEQDNDEFITRLPRSHEDVAMLRTMKTMQNEIGTNSGAAHVKMFRVQRTKVLQALSWLKIKIKNTVTV